MTARQRLLTSAEVQVADRATWWCYVLGIFSDAPSRSCINAVVVGACLAGPQAVRRGRQLMLSSAAGQLSHGCSIADA